MCQQLRRKALRDIKGIGVGPFSVLRLLQIGPVGPADVNPAGFPNDLRGQAGVVGVEMGEGHIYIPGVHIQLRQPGKQSAAALLLPEAGIDKQAALPPAEQVAVQFPGRGTGIRYRPSEIHSVITCAPFCPRSILPKRWGAVKRISLQAGGDRGIMGKKGEGSGKEWISVEYAELSRHSSGAGGGQRFPPFCFLWFFF